MKNFNSIGLLAAVFVLSACGSQSTRDSWNNQNGLTTTTTGGSTTGTQTGSNDNPYNLDAAVEQRIEMGGQTGTDPTKTLNFKTSKTLRVKITPLAAPNLTVPGYGNWVFPYACLQVTVSVNGITQTTQVLRVSGMASAQCQNAPTSQILDFTSSMSGSGNGVTVTIQNANYDNCRYSWQMYYGCYMSQVWQNHRVAMNVQVQTDQSWMSN